MESEVLQIECSVSRGWSPGYACSKLNAADIELCLDGLYGSPGLSAGCAVGFNLHYHFNRVIIGTCRYLDISRNAN